MSVAEPKAGVEQVELGQRLGLPAQTVTRGDDDVVCASASAERIGSLTCACIDRHH